MVSQNRAFARLAQLVSCTSRSQTVWLIMLPSLAGMDVSPFPIMVVSVCKPSPCKATHWPSRYLRYLTFQRVRPGYCLWSTEPPHLSVIILEFLSLLVKERDWEPYSFSETSLRGKAYHEHIGISWYVQLRPFTRCADTSSSACDCPTSS